MYEADLLCTIYTRFYDNFKILKLSGNKNLAQFVMSVKHSDGFTLNAAKYLITILKIQ